jgi:hypothetical protein
VKSDVFSFGVLILEIISGRKVATSFRRYKRSDNLMAYVSNLLYKRTILLSNCTTCFQGYHAK